MASSHKQLNMGGVSFGNRVIPFIAAIHGNKTSENRPCLLVHLWITVLGQKFGGALDPFGPSNGVSSNLSNQKDKRTQIMSIRTLMVTGMTALGQKFGGALDPV